MLPEAEVVPPLASSAGVDGAAVEGAAVEGAAVAAEGALAGTGVGSSTVPPGSRACAWAVRTALIGLPYDDGGPSVRIATA